MIDAKNFLLIVAVLAIMVFVGIIIPGKIFEKRQEQATEQTRGGAEVVVTYTKNGFEPEEITVRVGTTVAWINQSGRPMWVASDPHPSHTDLPGFDQVRIINFNLIPPVRAHGGEGYEYTFTKAGRWKYHNHIYPQDRGAVVVKSEK